MPFSAGCTPYRNLFFDFLYLVEIHVTISSTYDTTAFSASAVDMALSGCEPRFSPLQAAELW